MLGAPESFGQFQLSYRTGDVVSPRLDSREPLVAELADFARAVRRQDPMHGEIHLAREVVRHNRGRRAVAERGRRRGSSSAPRRPGHASRGGRQANSRGAR